MRIKLNLANVLFLVATIFVACSENSTVSSNKETPTPVPKIQESNARQNTEQPNFNNISTNETREIYQELAKNNRLKTPTPLPKADFPVVIESNRSIKDEAKRIANKEKIKSDDFDNGSKRMADVSTGGGRSYYSYRKDSKDIQEVRVYDKDDKNPKKSLVVYLKKGLKCELPIEQLSNPDPEKVSSEEIMRIVKANSKKCSKS